jgi:16S rRNA (cytosine1402-N4)-methyltransferase
MVITHHPVLYNEVMTAINPTDGGRYVDATVGAGGHAAGLLELSSPTGLLLGFDLDSQAIEIASQRLLEFGPRVNLRRGSYTNIKDELDVVGWNKVDGILFDLGASSIQFDSPDRGFSFLSEAPLDMRFSNQSNKTAGDIINNVSEKELVRILFQYGEERYARRIANAIIEARPIYDTKNLAEVVANSVKFSRSRIHPATRTFQALRIATNDELENIELGVPQAIGLLVKGGRLAVIAFHSLEDRIVKNAFKRESEDCICPPKQPICTCTHHAQVKLITKKPITPGREEISANHRSRSAKLRVIEKL